MRISPITPYPFDPIVFEVRGIPQDDKAITSLSLGVVARAAVVKLIPSVHEPVKTLTGCHPLIDLLDGPEIANLLMETFIDLFLDHMVNLNEDISNISFIKSNPLQNDDIGDIDSSILFIRLDIHLTKNDSTLKGLTDTHKLLLEILDKAVISPFDPNTSGTEIIMVGKSAIESWELGQEASSDSLSKRNRRL